MSAAKFEKLIDLIINEDQERAEQLFHEIVVEKSREIYESLMSEDMTTGLLDEIEMEEEGMDGMMEDDEFVDDEIESDDITVDGGDEEFGDSEEEISFDAEEGEEEGEGDLEDRVVDLEDKLDELMAEFEAKMGHEEEEEGEEEEEEGEEEESGLAEGFEGKPVKGLYTSKIGGDDGSQTVSPVLKNSGQAGMAAKPVKIATGDEKGRTAPSVQNVKDAGSFKNVAGKDNFSEKGESAPKPVTKQASGVNTKDVVPESRQTTKRRI
jgi:hypothetical protein